MSRGWTVAFDPEADVCEVEAGEGATSARDEATGATAVASGVANASSVLEEYLRGDGVRSPDGPAAVAVHDPRVARLIAARDATGLLPLFHARSRERHLVGTEARTLLDAPGVHLSPNRLALACWLAGAPLDSPETLFTGLNRIPAGHVLTIGRGQERLSQDWTPPSPGTFSPALGDEFGARLEEAIAAFLGDRQTAVLLSGGIDSSAVATAAAVACRRSGVPPPTVLGVDFVGASEGNMQALVAEQLGTRLLTGRVEATPDLLDRGLERIAASLWPTAAPWAPVFDELVLRAREEGACVLLDGQGGDDFLDAAVAGGRELLRRPISFVHWLQAERRYLGGVVPSVRALVRAGRRPRSAAVPGWIHPDLDAAVAERLQRRPRTYDELRAADAVDAVLSAQREETYDWSGRAGLEHLHPLWSRPVVELLCGLPAAALVAGGDPKSPARRYLRSRLAGPRGSWPRPATADVIAAGLSARARNVFHRLGGLPMLESLEVVNLRGSEFQAGVPWVILSVEAWLQPREGRT